jgi:peptidoglycan hydrolase-like protein with peptidoglycan-binding domain
VFWRIVKMEQASFGKRVLRRGCRGDDVKELQQRLAAKGFYFGPPDGCFGVLTEEAVRLLQQTFKMRQDGLAGSAVVAALTRDSTQTGRIIYTVLPGDNLAQISMRFKVLPTAWRHIPGRRPGVRRIYPGQRLLLYQKAFFVWDDIPDSSVMAVTGIINCPTTVDTNEEVGGYYQLLNPAGPDGETGQATPDPNLAVTWKLKPASIGKIGLDLRTAAARDLLFRDGWFRKCLRTLGLTKLPFVLLPLPLAAPGFQRLFWAQMDWIGRYAGIIMIEPIWDESTVENFQASARQWEKVLPQFARIGGNQQLLLVLPTYAWHWDADRFLRRVTLAEVKLTRALYHQNTVAPLPGGFIMIRYLSQGRQQCLIYRECFWWEQLLQQIIKYNFTGLVIRDFRALGEEGPQLIAGAFSVLPKSLFRVPDWRSIKRQFRS